MLWHYIHRKHFCMGLRFDFAESLDPRIFLRATTTLIPSQQRETSCNYALKDVEIASSFPAGYSFGSQQSAVTAEHSHADSCITRTSEEQSNDGLDNNSSDDEELSQPDENSEYDLDEDTLDDTKIEALFAPATVGSISLPSRR